MNGVKRKEPPTGRDQKTKKQKIEDGKALRDKKRDERAHKASNGFAKKSGNDGNAKQLVENQKMTTGGEGGKQFKLDTTSAETHAKQRALTKERKASKPNADAIQRSKKIWERLRRKSHVPLEERKELVAELFDIITGRIRDFVFKHDSVRVIQCALKYANQEQRRTIIQELKGDIRTLTESKYGKFLVAKMIQEHNDKEARDAVIPEFYGHVRRLINHPEASWIMDDIYRQVATPEQKAMMLREWYGAEFALFHRKPNNKGSSDGVLADETADLKVILQKHPEKRKPILQYLLQMINGLIQKKMTGFTMLHDAMLQYFLALIPGSEEHIEFLEILKGDIDKDTEGGGGDLYRNLAFTKSGSRLLCLALAYAGPKDRKTILRVLKDPIELMAYDQYGNIVLVVGLDVCDDTKMSSKAILLELLGKDTQNESEKLDRLERMVGDLNARLPILYPMVGMAKWLFSDAQKAILEEVMEIKKTTSKKEHEVRQRELVEYLSPSVLELVAKRAESLTQSSFGCQFITETLLEANGEHKDAAKTAVAQLAAGNPAADGHIAKTPASGRMLKTLVTGGNFDPVTKEVKLAEPQLNFGEVLYPFIKDRVVDWACSASSFVVVAMLESEDVPENIKNEVLRALQKEKARIQEAATGGTEVIAGEKGGKKNSKGNAGAKILLEKIA